MSTVLALSVLAVAVDPQQMEMVRQEVVEAAWAGKIMSQ
jgi:hypothetical protein